MKTKIDVRNLRRHTVKGLGLKILVIMQLLWALPDTHGQDKLCFNFASFSPTIDGVIAGDPSWVNSNRYVFNNGSTIPHAIVQMIRQSGFLYLSFEINNDPTFEDEDVIVLTFAPDATAANHRRIHIFPVATNVGNVLTAPGGPPRLVRYWTNSSSIGGWNSSPNLPLPAWLDTASGNIRVTSSSTGVAMKSYFVEIRIPIVASASGPGINIPSAADFGLYFNVIRVTQSKGSLIALDELRWPTTAPQIGGALPAPIQLETNTPTPTTWGNGTLVGPCTGVLISSATDIFTNQVPNDLVNVNSTNNIISATVTNTGSAPASGVTATFESARFGLPGSGSYGLIPAPGNPTTASGSIAAGGGTATLSTLSWDVLHDPNRPAYVGNTGLCTRVTLNSTVGGTLIANKVNYRNMHFGTASIFEHPAEISTIGYGAPPDGLSSHQFDLYVGATEEAINRDEKTRSTVGAKCDLSQLTRLVHGYRHTGRFIIIEGKKYALRESVNSFGHIIEHLGNRGTNWRQEMVGGGITKLPDNHYTITIPPNSVAVVNTTIEAVEAKEEEPGCGRFALSAHAGISQPHGSFDESYDPSRSFTFDFEYQLPPRGLSLEAILEFHKFQGVGTHPDLDVTFYGVQLKYQLPPLESRKAKPFVTFGGGRYQFDPGATVNGLNAGAGLRFVVSCSVGLEMSYNYHDASSKDPKAKFSAIQAGLKYKF